MKKFIAVVVLLLIVSTVGALAEDFALSGLDYQQLLDRRAQFNAAFTEALAGLPNNPAQTVDKATRRAPAVVGQHVSIASEIDDIPVFIDLVVEEIYRGDAFKKLVGKGYFSEVDNPKTQENIAARVTVAFKDLGEGASEDADPELTVDNVFSFDAYHSTGRKYESVIYDMSEQPELTNIYVGASTTGYLYFQIDKDDSAPYLVYTPEIWGDSAYWVLLK